MYQANVPSQVLDLLIRNSNESRCQMHIPGGEMRQLILPRIDTSYWICVVLDRNAQVNAKGGVSAWHLPSKSLQFEKPFRISAGPAHVSDLMDRSKWLPTIKFSNPSCLLSAMPQERPPRLLTTHIKKFYTKERTCLITYPPPTITTFGPGAWLGRPVFSSA